MAKVMTERRRDPKEAAQMRALKAPKQPTAPKHLRDIAAGSLDYQAALLFWHVRNTFADFAVTIPEADVLACRKSMDYQEQEPKLVVDARKNTKGEAFLVVRIADAKTGDQIRVSESTEADLDRALDAKKVRAAKDQIPQLVANMKNELANGVCSDETAGALCKAAMLVAGS